MSIVKFINVRCTDPSGTIQLHCYLSDYLKTSDGKYIDGLGFVTDDFMAEFEAVKRANQKTSGSQFRQITVSISPVGNDHTNAEYLEIGRRIATYYYDKGHQAVIYLHLDTDVRHLHILLNSVNFRTGKMFTQSRSELNRFKLQCNHVFSEYGLDLIRKPAETLTDTTVHELCDGFECLELFDEVMADKAAGLADLFVEPAVSSRDYEPQSSICWSRSTMWPDIPFMRDFDRIISEPAEYITTPDDYNIKEESVLNTKSTQELPSVTTDQLPAEFNSATPGLTLNCSRNINISFPADADTNKLADLVNSVEPLPETDRAFNTKLGIAATAELQNRGYDIPVTVDCSTNINMMFEDVMRSSIIDIDSEDDD